eukprot:TRINITY_DN65762_c12_g7_i3.p1 TRINITY_DN65762_c12_g7~~TRINITY_DN65762_c12_g7_i3.p1  ORF type:complete len:368 (+),score=33.32 TRINITY_DN65762_c12_g7_i3:65-1168(+)
MATRNQTTLFLQLRMREHHFPGGPGGGAAESLPSDSHPLRDELALLESSAEGYPEGYGAVCPKTGCWLDTFDKMQTMQLHMKQNIALIHKLYEKLLTPRFDMSDSCSLQSSLHGVVCTTLKSFRCCLGVISTLYIPWLGVLFNPSGPVQQVHSMFTLLRNNLEALRVFFIVVLLHAILQQKYQQRRMNLFVTQQQQQQEEDEDDDIHQIQQLRQLIHKTITKEEKEEGNNHYHYHHHGGGWNKDDSTSSTKKNVFGYCCADVQLPDNIVAIMVRQHISRQSTCHGDYYLQEENGEAAKVADECLAELHSLWLDEAYHLPVLVEGSLENRIDWFLEAQDPIWTPAAPPPPTFTPPPLPKRAGCCCLLM